MHIAITGGAGFIGSNLAELALAQGHDVTIVDDFSTGFAENLEDMSVGLIRSSILDREALRDAFSSADSVIHLAALGSVPRSVNDPFATHAANATGTLSVLEAARTAGVQHLVSASSSSVYGLNPASPKQEREWVRPLSPYAVTKLTTEQYTLAYQDSFGLRTVAFRFFNVYGPRQRAGHAYAAVIPTFVDALLNDKPLYINGDPQISRDFTYVGAVCSVLLNTAERQLSHPEPINLAFGSNTTLSELITSLEVATGQEARIMHRGPRPGDVKHSRADSATLRSLFPEIRSVSLEEGLSETVAWFRRSQALSSDS